MNCRLALAAAAAFGFLAAGCDVGYDTPPAAPATTTTAPTTTAPPETTTTADDGVTLAPNTGVASTVAIVESVHDGDTFTTVNGWKIRPIGINAPEINGAVDGPGRVDNDACWGAEATQALKDLLPPGTHIGLVPDTTPLDRYGRHLFYVEAAGVGDVGAQLVAAGHATSYRYPPDVARSDAYDRLQGEAQAAGAGLWGAC